MEAIVGTVVVHLDLLIAKLELLLTERVALGCTRITGSRYNQPLRDQPLGNDWLTLEYNARILASR